MKTLPAPLCAIRPRRTQRGVSLLEVLISLLIFSVGVLGIVGLHAAASKNAGEPQYRAVAAYLAEQLAAQYWTNKAATKSNLTTDQINTWKAQVAAALPAGSAPEVSYNSVTNQLRTQICWKVAGKDETHCHETNSRIGLND